MVSEGQQKHRAGALKQANKAHKTGRHRSKGSISTSAKGKVDVKTFTKGARKELNKEARRHQAQQIRQKKRDEVFSQRRKLGGGQAPPIIVTIVPLHKQVNVDSIVSLLTQADETISVDHSQQGTLHIGISRFKQRFTFLVPKFGDVFATLDAAKVSTILLFAVSVAETPACMRDLLDAEGEEMINACRAQGLPNSIMLMTDLESVSLKKRQQFKQTAQSYLSKWLPEEKVMPLDKPADALNLLRRMSTQKQTNVSYMSKRSYLLAESLEYSSADQTLKISGFLRGTPLSVNGLVHIPGFGDFQMSQIDKLPDPFSLDDNRDRLEETLEIADPTRQESLESENVPDPMDAEQTWPTEEEMAEAATEKSKKKTKLVPKGTSDYQAAWIVDEVDEESDNSESDEENMDMGDSDTDSEAADDDEQDMCSTSEISPDANQYDEEMDFAEERQAIEKLKEAKLDAQFPDEVDTPPVGTFAKDRFQKYRGLQSFRTSPWDPKENLPLDYARIFQFQCFNRTRKRILKEQLDVQGVDPGQFVVLHVKNVSQDLMDGYMATGCDKPLVVIGLLPNEQKMSLLNVVLKHVNPHSAKPIKSKEKLMFQCGFRRFSACPIFSQHTNGSKHKYARFFQPGDTVVASMYAPIIFPPCTVLCYKEGTDGMIDLVASGSVLSADPNRLVIKRVVLSGHPFKVHKKSAVIRFMFNHREDILWFKPVQLHTKYGRRGHIREPLGTHGHMKCVFDGQLKSQDTVLMNLYKRIFPKWTYEPILFTSH